MSKNYFEGKVVFLTGASSGIGAALAIAIAKRGAVVGLLARRRDKLEEISRTIEKVGGRALIFEADVTDFEAVAAAANELRNQFGKIDILIANAGIGGNDRPTRNFEARALAKVIDINLKGAMNAVSAVLPQMLENREGHLVAVSSLAGFRGLPKSAAYSASKAGMNAFFESVRLDVRDRGLFVTIIQPGFIKTPLTSGRSSKMPFIMDLKESMPYFLEAIERRKKYSAFPWQLASIVRAARFLPSFLYDRLAGRARYRE